MGAWCKPSDSLAGGREKSGEQNALPPILTLLGEKIEHLEVC